MLNLPIAELLALWSELDDALHGVNGFGGDTAELYLYRFQPASPAADLGMGTSRDDRIRRANESLCNLLDHFAQAREARIAVNGRRLGRWVRSAGFDHRVHVRVTERRGP